jgi:hypothetical protein
MAIKFIREHHYSKGASNTQTYGHGLFRKGNPWELIGVTIWLPPTRVACESVNRSDWKKVISLTRLAVHPDVPKNAASYLIAASIRMIKEDGRFVSLVNYADESQGHSGAIYRATNWTYVGRTGPYPKWVDSNGKQVAQKSTVNRVKSKMIELGHTNIGTFFKHKFVIHLDVKPMRANIKPIKDEQEMLF